MTKGTPSNTLGSDEVAEHEDSERDIRFGEQEIQAVGAENERQPR